MEIIFLLSAAIIGLLGFFEPCTIATHTLFGIRTHQDKSKAGIINIILLIITRTLLYILLLTITLPLFNKIRWQIISPEIIFIFLSAIYLISRYSYIPIPHINFAALLPKNLKQKDSIRLGLTLPACTIPLFIVVLGLSLTVHKTYFSILLGITYSFMFTLPTVITFIKGTSLKTRKFFIAAAKITPFVTSGLFLIAAIILFTYRQNFNLISLQSLLKHPSAGGIIIGFVAGIIFSFNPVSFSVIPVIVAYVTKAGEKKQALKLGVVFVAGMIFTHLLLGVAAALGGKWVQSLMGRFWGIFLGPILIILGLIWVGTLKINLPWFGLKGKKKLGLLSTFLFAIPFSIAVCPFCSPALLVMLTASAAIGSVTFGFSLLFAFALGRGIPVIIGAWSMGMLESMQFFSQYQKPIEKIAGIVLILSGLYFLNQYFFLVNL